MRLDVADPDVARCYVRAWTPVEVAQCAQSGVASQAQWITFVGDSELRGMVIGFLLLLTETKHDEPTSAEWLGVNMTVEKTRTNPGGSVAAVDWLLRVSLETGKVVQVCDAIFIVVVATVSLLKIIELSCVTHNQPTNVSLRFPFLTSTISAWCMQCRVLSKWALCASFCDRLPLTGRIHVAVP
jgi:hypothetical protein